MNIKNKKIFITGGGGYLGKHLVERYYKDNEITVYSRDEAKHYFLKKQFPNIRCIVGDIRNYDLLKRSSKNQDIGIFAASLKQIEAVDQNVEEAIEIIVRGAINSRRVSEENELQSACFVSSDKSRAATTLYGSMKFLAGESFIVNTTHTGCKLSSVVYGNVLNSTGSVIPLIWNAILNKYSLTLYSPEMTRFMITIEQAMDLIEVSLDYNGYNVIPKLKSFAIKDLFQIYSEKFGLKYEIGRPRISEKIHEIMISAEEMPRTTQDENYFYMHYKNVSDSRLPLIDFSSRDQLISKSELDFILQSFNYYQA
jgi:UDP-glucose 4-epimerase